MSVSAIRRFLRNITVAFDGKRLFDKIADYWRNAVRSLRQKARSLSNYLKELKLKKATRKGREIALVGGRVEGGEFARLMRTARSVEAFEDATASRLSTVGRQAFRRVDDIAEFHFPDLAIQRRSTYLLDTRNDLVARSVVSKGTVVVGADALETLVRKDVKLLDRANRVSRVVSRTKKILFLGVAVAATGVGIAYICSEAAKHAAANSGCFMYLNDNGNIRRCRAPGCSCLIGSDGKGSFDPAPSKDKTLVTCRDEDLWERMRVNRSDCAEGATGRDKGNRYCVHCDWEETDPKSVNFVDKEALPENAYVRCEHQDALDAFNEMVGGTVDSIWDAVGSAGKKARDMFASSAQILPWILGIIGFVIAVAVSLAIWRFFRRASGGDEHEPIKTYER